MTPTTRTPTSTCIVDALPSAEALQRMGTRFSREQIVAALVDYEAMVGEWDAMLVAVCDAFTVADPGWDAYPGAMKGCPVQWVADMYARLFWLGSETHYAINRSEIHKGKFMYRTEPYPVDAWQRGIRKSRKQIAEILAELAQHA